jgi:cytochrome c2
MAYAGLKDDTKIADVIAYLKQFGADGKRTQ